MNINNAACGSISGSVGDTHPSTPADGRGGPGNARERRRIGGKEETNAARGGKKTFRILLLNCEQLRADWIMRLCSALLGDAAEGRITSC